MLLYTEAQLQHAYIGFVREMYKQSFVVVPTLEEFRLIYEQDMLEKYSEEKDGSR
jgi:hypothetical protein